MKSASHYFKSQIGSVPRNLGQNCTEVFLIQEMRCGFALSGGFGERKSIAVSGGLKAQKMNIIQKIIEAHKFKFGSLPPLQQCSVSGSALFNADCMDILPLIPDKSVQLILADLPFNTKKRTTWNDWDKEIDLDLLWIQYDRIITDNGCIVLFGYGLFAHQLALSSCKYKYDLIWQKNRGTGFLNCKRMPLSDFENILVFYGKQCTYNPQMKEGKPYSIKKGSLSSNYAKTDKIVTTNNNGERYPTRILYYPNDKKALHPTQKPLELIKYLLKTYSNENDMVLDNTMGVGTTCLGAKELNRSFIGIEKEVKYYELAVGRVFGQHCH